MYSEALCNADGFVIIAPLDDETAPGEPPSSFASYLSDVLQLVGAGAGRIGRRQEGQDGSSSSSTASESVSSASSGEYIPRMHESS